nr:pentapeptide repeat-containing protein [Desulfobulbaceae bacterium]
MKKLCVLSSLWLVVHLFSVTVYGFDQVALETLLSTNECLRCDLTGADLSGRTLTKAKLEGSNLAGANLSNTILRMADLQGADFRNADLTFTVFEAADLYKANFDGANLEGTVFDGAYLVDAVFSAATIARATGQEASMEKLTVEEPVQINVETAEQQYRAKVAEVPVTQVEERDSTEAVLTATDVERMPVIENRAIGQGIESLIQVPEGAGGDPSRYAPNPVLNITGFRPLKEEVANVAEMESLSPLSKDDLLDKVGDTQMCVGCDFSGMNLADKKLKGLYLEGGRFEGANLEGANLQSANLKGANLRNANLKGADLRKADLYKADLSGADLSGADLEDALVLGANLSGANLEGTVLSQGPVIQ